MPHSHLSRRLFFGTALTGSCAAASAAAADAAHAPVAAPQPAAGGRDYLTTLPNFCAHEHWGSIGSIGTFPGGFRADREAGAVPYRPTTLFDILLDPYFGGWLAAGGASPDALARKAGARDFGTLAAEAPEAAFRALAPALEDQGLAGAYQCLRQGIDALYGVDIAACSADAIPSLSAAIGRNYARLFDWYEEAMRRSHFSALIRPVHPEFYTTEHTSQDAARERRFTHTILRIDPLLDLWPRTCPRRDTLAGLAGVEPRDAASWRAFITALFDRAAAAGATGIKQLQAYARPLDFAVRDEADVRWSGDLRPEEVRVHQDWVMHECCRQAHERGWVHQVHAGTHNLAQSNPLPLAALAARYPRMKLVQLHCWPFLEEAGFLAKHHANVFIDTCWQVILSPEYFRTALRAWLNYVPLHKIMCSHDATSVEMAAGAARITRGILGETLGEQRSRYGINEEHVRRIAARLLNDNAAHLYGIAAPRRD